MLEVASAPFFFAYWARIWMEDPAVAKEMADFLSVIGPHLPQASR